MLKSTSWPIPATTGTGQAATARAKASSLNAAKSSREPPPRASNNTSISARAATISNIRIMAGAARSPWTGVGYTTTGKAGNRLRNTRNTSCTAAPLGEVITPTARGMAGIGRLRAASNNPSAASRVLVSSKARRKAPSPAASMCSAMSWKSPRPSYNDTRARIRICIPSAGFRRRPKLRFRNMAQRTWAAGSLRVKYQCPERGRDRFDNSPSTHSNGNAPSRMDLASRLRRETVQISAGDRVGTSDGGDGIP